MTIISSRPLTRLHGSTLAPLRSDTLTPDTTTPSGLLSPVSPPAPTTPVAGPASDHADAFPRRASEHAPNLATLAQLRSSGRNPLLTATSRRSRPVRRGGCAG